MIGYDLLNFIIAVLALLVAVYSIFYTHRQNRHRITISSSERYADDNVHVMHCFEINNICPSSVTLDSISFRDNTGNSVIPLEYEPESDSLTHIPNYMYSNPLMTPCVLQPYQDIPLGYYFEKSYDSLTITIRCNERIHCFKNRQSFLVHFSDIQE